MDEQSRRDELRSLLENGPVTLGRKTISEVRSGATEYGYLRMFPKPDGLASTARVIFAEKKQDIDLCGLFTGEIPMDEMTPSTRVWDYCFAQDTLHFVIDAPIKQDPYQTVIISVNTLQRVQNGIVHQRNTLRGIVAYRRLLPQECRQITTAELVRSHEWQTTEYEATTLPGLLDRAYRGIIRVQTSAGQLLSCDTGYGIHAARWCHAGWLTNVYAPAAPTCYLENGTFVLGHSTDVEKHGLYVPEKSRFASNQYTAKPALEENCLAMHFDEQGRRLLHELPRPVLERLITETTRAVKTHTRTTP